MRIENHGSLFLFRPERSGEARWLRKTAPEEAQFFGGALVVEPRYVGDVAEAVQEAGFPLTIPGPATVRLAGL